MRLPNADLATVVVRKLRDYALSTASERGRHKARVFARALGLGPSDAEWLRSRILEGVRDVEATQTARSPYGTLYRCDVHVQTRPKSATVRTAWIVRSDEAFPRLTTCFVL